jgi:hypothetical protein
MPSHRPCTDDDHRALSRSVIVVEEKWRAQQGSNLRPPL